jgi:hypothetical protein
MAYHYKPEILDALARHGFRPRADTSPERLRDAVRELYKYEIRRLRDQLLAGRVERRNYSAEVVELRKRYWVLSVPTVLWAER